MPNRSVLIVDDEEDIRANVSAFLEDEGLDVEAVESGEQAIKRLEIGESYGVCVMDIRLPGLDGNRTILALHELSPQTQFVIYTGSVNYSLPHSLQTLGISEEQVFMKPLEDMGALAELVRILLAK